MSTLTPQSSVVRRGRASSAIVARHPSWSCVMHCPSVVVCLWTVRPLSVDRRPSSCCRPSSCVRPLLTVRPSTVDHPSSSVHRPSVVVCPSVVNRQPSTHRPPSSCVRPSTVDHLSSSVHRPSIVDRRPLLSSIVIHLVCHCPPSSSSSVTRRHTYHICSGILDAGEWRGMV